MRQQNWCNVDNAVIAANWQSDNDYYAMATIPGGMYTGTDKDVTTTFGVGATFVSSSTRTSPDVVYQIVKAVFERFQAGSRRCTRLSVILIRNS